LRGDQDASAADEHFPRLKHLWVEAGYPGEDKGKEWAEKTFGWSVDLVERPKEPAPRKVLLAWAEQWSHEGWWSIGRRSCHPRGSWCCLGVGW
jgi:hypothetical protein